MVVDHIDSQNTWLEAIKELGILIEGGPVLIGIKSSELRYLFANKELEMLYGARTGG